MEELTDNLEDALESIEEFEKELKELSRIIFTRLKNKPKQKIL